MQVPKGSIEIDQSFIQYSKFPMLRVVFGINLKQQFLADKISDKSFIDYIFGQILVIFDK